MKSSKIKSLEVEKDLHKAERNILREKLRHLHDKDKLQEKINIHSRFKVDPTKKLHYHAKKVKTLRKGIIHEKFEFAGKVALVLLLILITLFLFKKLDNPTVSGLAIYGTTEYEDVLDWKLNGNEQKYWFPAQSGEIKSVKVSGSFEGDVKVYIENDDEQYLVLNSETLDNGGYDFDAMIDNSVDSEEVTINLKYSNGINDDNILGFTVEDTLFNVEINESNLCTQWEVYSLENEAAESTCYGAEACCGFLSFDSERENWNEIFYLNEEKLGTTKNNVVSALILNFDFSTDPENVYSNIYYSELHSLKAVFYDQVIEFEDVCVDTCNGLEEFKKSLYKFNVVGLGQVNLSNVSYGVVTTQEVEEGCIPDAQPCNNPGQLDQHCCSGTCGGFGLC